MGFKREFVESCRRGAPGLVRLLWQQALWAVPFALFFWGMFAAWTLPGLVRSYQISLVFAYVIGLSLWAVETFAIPRLARRQRDERAAIGREGLVYSAAALAGGYLSALLIHLFILPGFLGSTRAVVITGLFTLLFTVLFGGISYAIHFYRQSLERARAVEKARAELAQAELRALRAQINPHFLFNTLNSIASLIALNPAAAEDVTTRLADVFRYALTASGRDTVRFGDELQFLRDLLAIERVRFSDRLTVHEDIEPGLDAVPIPGLLLQPIMENAVKYGVSTRTEGGTIVLTAKRNGEHLVVEVHDDGPGMEARGATPGTGFGLASVRERLRAAGLTEALDITSAPGAGTRVRITFPITDSVPPSRGGSS